MSKISEFVSLGHPDKVADYISEFILDELIKQDKNTKYALEVQIKDNHICLGGEIGTNAEINYDNCIKQAIESIGYTKEYCEYWGKENTIDVDNLQITKCIGKQSNEIFQGVEREGWGDQGIMFGMAYNSPEYDYFSKDYFLAKQVNKLLFNKAQNWKTDDLKLGLDIKSLVVFDDKNDKIKKIIVAVPTKNDNTMNIENFIRENIKGDYELVVNGTGCYVKHASIGDAGTTGRKLVVDFYGGGSNIGGGSPWTKDGTKADLTLNLYARKLALDFVKKEKVNFVKVAIACCIGKSDLDITYFDDKNNEILTYKEDKKTSELIKMFQLDTPIYASLCRDGLFSKIV